MNPDGQAAFVTGAAGGIGLGIARALIEAGARVAIADIDAERLATAAQELRSAGGQVVEVVLDVGDPDAWIAAADQAESALGPISILINNAGVIGSAGPLEDTAPEVWRWVFRINVDGPFLGVRTFLPRFKERGTAAYVLNTASLAGVLPMSQVAQYCSSKFACVGFTKVLREELRGTNIGVSLLLPGTVATRMPQHAALAEAALTGGDIDTTSVEAGVSTAAQGADPDAVGRQVVEAIVAEQFVIVTHQEWGPIVAEGQDEVVSAFNDFDGRYGLDPASVLRSQGVNPVKQ